MEGGKNIKNYHGDFLDGELIANLEVSERLLNKIKESGKSYGELSEETGIHKSVIQRYATGETKKIPVDRLRLLVQALNTTVSEIAGWNEVMIPENEKLSEKEKDLINVYRKAEPVFQEEAYGMLKRHPREK